MENVSKHITLDEAITSATALRNGINNSPDSVTFERMKLVANKCFEPLREWYGKPIRINSFYRSQLLNVKVGGSSTSQHVKGEAIDISAGNKVENKKLYDWLIANLPEWDQILWEYGNDIGPDWIHISYKQKGNRKQVIRIK
jgi:zinc D-Ala-D-Ala carboxypeptidase